MSLAQHLEEFKKAKEDAQKRTALSVFIDPFLDVLVFLAFAFAMLKDLADISLGAIPIIGDLLSFIISVLAAIFIFLIMTLLGGRHFSFVVKKLIVLLVGMLIENIPGLRFLPIETLVVFINYSFILKERREEHQEQKQREFLEEGYA